MMRGADWFSALRSIGLVFSLVGLLLVFFAVSTGTHVQAAPLASPPNPPDWIKTPPMASTLLKRAGNWMIVDAGSPAEVSRDDAADVVLVTGMWANPPADALKRLKARPDGDRLLIAAADSVTLPMAMEAMTARFDGIAIPASDASRDRIDALVADLRKRDPDFLILLDLGDGLPSADAMLPHGDGLIVRNVLADARGAPYPDDEAAARLEVLRSRSLTVLVAEQSRDPETSAKLAERLRSLGAIPFVSPVP
jgi:hypothetical protein